MHADHLFGLALVLVLGIGAQWISWRLRQPAILLLLVAGILAGPVTGILHPDELVGGLLMPFVSLAVALILFEGGLTLHVHEVEGLRFVLGRLVLVGGGVTLLITAVAAHFVLGLDPGLSALLGAVLVVSGPTVIVPILRQVRPGRQVGSILKWEAMVIDPVGVMVAVLIFQALLESDLKRATTGIALGLLKTLVIGLVVGALGAFLMVLVLARDWVPDYLHSSVTLMIVVLAHAISNQVQPEAGLAAVTLMGAFLANQHRVVVKHIVEFKENLRVLLIAVLFVLLAARVDLDDVIALGGRSLVFLAVLVLVGRPLSVALATAGSPLSRAERLFLGWMHPRGVVSAAAAAVFALRLAEVDHPGAEALVPVTFLVIIGTILVYGVSSRPLAIRLGLARPDPQGLLIVGAQPWVRSLAKMLRDEGFGVLLADSNWRSVSAARLEGLPAWYGDILSEHAISEMDLGGLGRLMALTPNEEVNSLAALHLAEVFGRSSVYQLAPASESRGATPRPHHLRGRIPWRNDLDEPRLRELFAAGAELKRTPLTEEFGWEDWKNEHGDDAIALFIAREGRELRIVTPDQPAAPEPGDVVISLVLRSEQASRTA